MSGKKNPEKSKQGGLQNVPKDKKIEKVGEIRIEGFVSSRDRRDQAKRDENEDKFPPKAS